MQVSYEDMEFEESSGNEDSHEGEGSEEECRGNADSREDQGVLSSLAPTVGAISRSPSSMTSSPAVSPLEDNRLAVINRPGSGLHLCQITDANPSEHPGNITAHYLNREKAHHRWHLGWRDPKDNKQVYQATSKQKRRARGYVPVTEVVDPSTFVRRGFEMTRFGRLPEEVELILKHTYILNKQSS